MDESSNVHLKWNKHQATLVSVFDALLGSEKLTDCTISAEGQRFRAHKIILSACSPYFEELFIENYEKHPIIILQDVKYYALRALMDFMYRGEVNVPQQELSGILKLSESLQIRGLCDCGYVDEANMQKGGGRNSPPISPESMRSLPASLACLTSGQKKTEEKQLQSFSVHRKYSPTLSPEEGGPTEIDSIPKTSQKYRSINHSVSDQRTDQKVFQEVISANIDSMRHVPSHSQVQPAASNSTGGSVLSAFSHQSMCSELVCSSVEVALATSAEKERFFTPEAVLCDKRSENLSSHQEKTTLETETKSENFESDMEIVEDLTLEDDDDDYYCDDGNYGNDDGKGWTVSQAFTYGENFRAREVNSLQSPFDNDYLSSSTLPAPSTSLPKRFDCSACGKSYLYRRGLWRHSKHECGKEPQFQCPRCNRRFSRSDNLKTHMASRRCRMQNSTSYFEGNG